MLYTVIHLNFKLDIILNIWSVWSRCQIIEGYFQIDKYRAAFIVLPRGREGCSEGGREDCSEGGREGGLFRGRKGGRVVQRKEGREDCSE